MSTGILFLSSLLFLSLVVCSVYTLAMDVASSPQGIARGMVKRLLRLMGLLAALAVIVYFFSLV